jgi:hypothetical protein
MSNTARSIPPLSSLVSNLSTFHQSGRPGTAPTSEAVALRAPRTSMSDRLATLIPRCPVLSHRRGQAPAQTSPALVFLLLLPSPLLKRLLNLVTGALIIRVFSSTLSPYRYLTDQRSVRPKTPLTRWKSLILWKTSLGKAFRSSGLGL